ncbi:MAG: exodeoxyribonuclease V subunit gamma [Clostridiales Family XIII bacterium]|jgi:ATP-dependent helicase/nuclease subunit B|nr:exodeoxyribonuclease V subunit gamma [Clostridiales Family XIII bacterium]
MGTLTIYVGRENTDREAFMFARIGERLDALERGREQGRIAVLVPDQFTLQAERDAFYYLNRTGFLRLEIISLSGLSHRVLEETGRDARTPVGKTGRHMLLSVILKRETPPLEAFASQAGTRAFIEMMNDLLSELKLHNVSPAAVRKRADEETDPILKRKLSDVARVYDAYEDMICGKYLDSEDRLRAFACGIPRSAFVRDAEVWMYGFDYLAARDMDAVQALVARARGVHIVLTGEARGMTASAGRDRELFRVTKHMLRKLRERAAEAGCPYAQYDINEIDESAAGGGRFAARRPPAAAHIERELFSYPFNPYKGEATDLTFLAASNYYTEAESAAAEIARLIRDEGYRYRDILVICNDMDTRASIIKRVFTEHGLPVFMDRRKNLLHNPVLEYITALAEVVAADWRVEDLCKLMKTGMSPVSRTACELLEAYATEYRFRGKGPWRRPFERLSPYERAAADSRDGAGGADASWGEKKLAALNEARELIAAHIQKFTEMIARDHSVEGRTEALYLFLRDEARLPEKTEAGVASLRARGRHEYADELSQVWESAVAVFDQMVAILGDESMSRTDYAELLAAGLESIEIGLLPSTADQILVGTMQRTRAGRVKALFVLGANDGVLPAAGVRDGVLNEKERAFVLGTDGGGAAGGPEDLRVAEEELAIYRNLSRPEQRLWISYAVSNPEGGELRPSLVFEKLRRIFPDRPLESDILSRNDALAQVTTMGGALGNLALALRQSAENRVPNPIWKKVYDCCRVHAPREIAALEQGFSFSNDRDRIGRDCVARLYGTRYDAAAARDAAADAAPSSPAAGGALSIRLSPSSLERYARCPFSHFVSLGLRPQEARVVEIGARERGDIFHKAIMAFSKALTQEGVRVSDADSAWMRLTEEDCEALVDAIFASVREETDVFGRGKPEQYRLERIRSTVGTAARIVAEQVKAGLIDEMYFEERFGAGGRFPPIVCDAGDALTIRIEGRIDRLDVLRGGRAKIIDYKSGAERFDAEEARAGWRLQLMLYLEVVTGSPVLGTAAPAASATAPPLRPAGVFYFKIGEPQTDCALWPDGESAARKAELALHKSFRLDGVVLDDQAVLRAIAGERFEEPHYANNRSNILPVRVDADKATGELRLVKSAYNTRALLDEEAFDRLRADVAGRVRALCADLADGVIDARPMRTNKENACTYCRFGGICGYDAAFDRGPNDRSGGGNSDL